MPTVRVKENELLVGWYEVLPNRHRKPGGYLYSLSQSSLAVFGPSSDPLELRFPSQLDFH
jgi:hypothetical protein